MKSYYSIEIRKTQEKLIDVLNNCKLPFTVQQLIINNLSNLIDSYATEEYNQDLQRHNQELEEEKKEQDKSSEEENK